VTVFAPQRAPTLIVAALLLSSCGVAGGVDEATKQGLEGARAEARRALARAGRLEDRLQGLAHDLKAARGDLAALQRRVGRRQERLDGAVSQLRSALRDLRQTSSEAVEGAAEALAAAGRATRDLSVLTRRFDYHLKSHGRG
jgi:ABC-type transporter Mla subunit MlaD